jgi:DNA-binding MarR family transcriptional regulator
MTDDDVRTFRSQMRSLQQRLRREVRPRGGLSRSALRVLAAADRAAGQAKPRDLADELQMTSSNVAAALRQLEGGGFVRREPDRSDARSVSVLPTASGRKLVADVRNERDTWLGRAIEARLDEREQRLLVDAGLLMQRLADFEPEVA